MSLPRVTLIDALTLAALAALVAGIVAPQSDVRRMARVEDAVIRQLAELDRREEEHRRRATTDADRDGRGEFVTLGEVLGPKAGDFTRVEGTDVWELGGWYFAVLLPDREKRAVSATAPEVVTDYAEVSKLIVAWPARPGETGMRAYCRWPGGVLLQHTIDGYPYTLRPPHPDAPLVVVEAGRIRPADRYGGRDWAPPVFATPRR